jgi:hypothetical protein
MTNRDEIRLTGEERELIRMTLQRRGTGSVGYPLTRSMYEADDKRFRGQLMGVRYFRFETDEQIYFPIQSAEGM